MAKLFFIDLETTGIDENKHGIVQFAGIIEIDGEIKEKINERINPFASDLIDEQALKVNNLDKNTLFSFKEPDEFLNQLKSTMNKYVDKFNRNDKFHFVGYNSRFDDAFLRRLFKKCNDNFYGSYFHFPAIDITNIVAMLNLDNRSSFPNFKLMSVAKFIGIKTNEESFHDAMYDIEITREIFIYLKESIIKK